MNNELNPKWYLYNATTNKPEGPIDSSEVQSRLSARSIQPNSYIWAEGMDDWVPINEVPELEPILRDFQPLPEKEFTGILQTTSLIQETPLEEPTALENETAEEKIEDMKTKTTTVPRSSKKKKKTSIKKIIFFLSFGGLLGGATYAYVEGLLDPLLNNPQVKSITNEIQPKLYDQIEKYSFLAPLKTFVNPVQIPEDVSDEDVDILLDAAGASLDERGAKVALARSTAIEHSSSPAFIITSNLPDGTVLDIKLIGVPETLLGQFEHETSKKVTLQKRITRVSGFSGPKNSAFPKGDYRIEVSLAAGTSTKPLYKEFQFLGGEKNAEYNQKLKEFHEKATAQASKEIADAKQFLTSLENHEKQVLSEFKITRKIRSFNVGKSRWNKFSNSSQSFIKMMKDTAATWTPEVINDGFFYGPLFTHISAAILQLETLQNTLNEVFSGSKHLAESAFIEKKTANETAFNTTLSAANELIQKIEIQNKESDGFPRKMK